jgi:hypothetical protein
LVFHGVPDTAHSWVSMEQLNQYMDAKKAAEWIEDGIYNNITGRD